MLGVRVIVLTAVLVALVIVVPVVMPVIMPVVMFMIMFMIMVMVVVVLVPIAMTALGLGRFVLILPAGKPHMHLHTLNAAALLWLTLQTKLVLKAQLGKLCLKILWADAKIDHGGKIHVAADSGKAVVIKNLHKTPVKKVQPGRCPVKSAAG